MVRSSRVVAFHVALLLAAVLCFGRTAKSQTWSQIGTVGSPGQALHCVFFWNSHVGIAAGPSQGLYYYRSGYWIKSGYAGLAPQAFRMIGGVLYAAAYREVWKSLDSGSTWIQTSVPENYAYDVYVSADGMLHGVSSAGSFARIDAYQCAIINDDGQFASFSSDGGITWFDASLVPNTHSAGGWSIYADTCRKTFFAMDEGGGTYYSPDGGKTWHQSSPARGLREDVMEGADGVLYHAQPTGYLRSVDAGFSWDSIGGPHTTDEDYHFCVFGPHGDTIVTFKDNAVWICTGASANARPEMPIVFTDSIQPCTATLIPITIVGYARSLTGHLSLASKLRTIDTAFLCPAGESITLWLPIDSSQDDETLTVTMQATDGCADYHWQKSITIHRLSPPPILHVAPTLAVKRCEPFELRLAIAAADCGLVLLDSVIFDSGLNVLSTNVRLSDTISSVIPDTLRFWVYTPTAGQRSIVVRLKGRLLEGNRSFDTTFRIALTITASSLPVASAPRTLSVSNCFNSVIPVLLHASPCDSVQFTGCEFTIDPSFSYQTNLTFPRTLAAGAVDSLWITFPPQGLSRTSILRVHLTGYDFTNNKPFDTTLTILATFSTSSAELDPVDALVQLDTISLCSSRDTIVTFRNNGCDTIRVTKNTTLWQAGWSASSQNLPITLAPGESLDLKVHFAPITAGGSTQYISYLLDGSSQTNVTSQEIRLSAIGVAGSAILSLPDTALAFDTMTDCNARGSLQFSLSKSGCDSLVLSDAHLDSSGYYTLDTKAPMQYTVRFAADSAGRYDAHFHIFSSGSHGENAHDTTIAFHAIVTRSPRVAALSLTAIDFGALHYCDERDTTVTLYNRGCKTVHIASLSLLSASFSIPVDLPFDIVPGDSVRFPIYCSADTMNVSATALLSFQSNSDSALPPVTLSSHLIPPEHFSLALSAQQQTGIDRDVTFSVLRSGVITPTVRSIRFALAYDGDLLTYKSADENDIKLISSSQSGLAKTSFVFSPATDREKVATLHFHTALAEQTTTDIQLSVDTVVTDALPTDCYVRLDSVSASALSVTTQCGDVLMQQTMRAGALTIQDLRSAPTGIVFTVVNPFEATVEANATVFDLLGRTIASQNMSVTPGITSHTMILRANNAPYVLRLGAAREALLQRFIRVPSE